MRVLYLTHSVSTADGYGRYSLETLNALRRRGVEALAASAMPGNHNADFNAPAMLKSKTERRVKPLLIAFDAWRLRSQARSCDMIHAMTEPFAPLAAYLARRWNKPYAVTLHGTYAVETLQGPWRDLYRRSFLGGAALFTVSRYTAGRLIAELPEAAERTAAIPLGVTGVDKVVPPATGREPWFLAVGAVKPRKGSDIAIQALAQVVRQVPQAKLLIAGAKGGDAFAGRIADLIAQHGLQDRVVMLGHISDAELVELYRRVRGLAMPSMNVGNHFEGFGLVHLEAAARGLPVIGSLGCGNEDAILDQRTGFLLPQGDIEGVADRMLRLLTDDDGWDAMSSQALRFATEMTWDRLGEAYDQRYREILRSQS